MNLLARRLPLALLAMALLSITVTLVVRWTTDGGPLLIIHTAVLGIYLCWLLAEAATTVRSSRTTEAATDRGTVNVYATFRLVTLVTAVFVANDWTGFRPWMPVAAVVFTGSVVFRLWAIRTLGHFYSHRVRLVGEHRLITTGPYRLVRHPAYTGMAISHIAFVLLFLNPFSAGALVALLLPTLVVRIMIEEKVLLEIPEYAEFAARRKRLIPFVW